MPDSPSRAKQGDSLVAARIPACAETCAPVLEDAAFASCGFGTAVTVSHLPPLEESNYPAVRMLCPHGVVWYAQPTPEQIGQWARDGVE